VLEAVPDMEAHSAYSIAVVHDVTAIAAIEGTWIDTGLAYPDGVIEIADWYNDEPRFATDVNNVVSLMALAAFPAQSVTNVGVVARVDFECRSAGTHRLTLASESDDPVHASFTVGPDGRNHANALRGATVSCDEGTSAPGEEIEPAEPGAPNGDGPANGAPGAPGSGDSGTGMTAPGERDADTAARAGAGLGDLGEGGGSSTLDRSGIAVLVAALAAIGVAFAVAAPLLRRRLRARGPAGE
jgi:hypothetical protein